MRAPRLPPVLLERALVGVSGGRDSVVLLHHLVAQGVAVEAAHVNYGLRGADSDADEALVRELCQRLGVRLHVRRGAPTDAPASNRQAWARAVRYTFFGETATAQGLPAVAVAHHADDQAETVLLALLRGRRLAALRGMKPRRWLDRERFPGVVLARPLLSVRSADLHAYATAHGLTWREDASNRDRRYRRNAVRHDLLPLLETLAPGVVPRLLELRDEAAAHDKAERAWQRRFVARHLDGDLLPLAALDALGPHKQAALLAALLPRLLPGASPDRTRVEAVRTLIDAQVGRRVVWPEGTVWRERDALRFVPAARASFQNPGAGAAPDRTGAVELLPGQTVAFGHGTFAAGDPGPMPADPGHDPHVAYVPRAAFPLTIRPWQAGERLDVLGSSGRPRIAGLLTRAKVPASVREDWPLVRSASGEALWLPGVRVGAGCAAAPGEASVRVVFSPASHTPPPYLAL